VRADFILKGKGQIKLATGESLTVGRDSDDSDFVVSSPNGPSDSVSVSLLSSLHAPRHPSRSGKKGTGTGLIVNSTRA
jgi:hypothetical protein